jgi:serine/threonine-protein kinase
MGIVYRGFEIGTGKNVAIKQVREEFSNNPEIRRRAHLEASLMFSHPNLVEMLGCCEVAPDRGPIFIISAYIEGENIDKFIDRKIRHLPHAEQRICNMFIPVLDALSYIHQKKIIHMDIKPSNIMVENERNVRLMDLGIADVSMMKSDIASGMMGTPKYAAPEQFAGTQKKTRLSSATDIYEAGVTLYELLTQQNPFPNKVEEACKMHQSIVLEKKGSISESVMAVIRTATAVNPNNRYQQASEIHASGSYTKDKDGQKHFYLCFGPKYAEAAKQVCELLNAGKPIKDAIAVINGATADIAAKREERKAERQERKAERESKPKATTEKMYTAAEVEQVVRKAFGALADAMKEDVKQFEPIIKAALPAAA